jgi:predicted ATP-dependent protease
VCAAAGLDGTQGVVLPDRNRRHLMLDPEVVAAVEQGLFHIYTARHMGEALEQLTDVASGLTLEPNGTAGQCAAYGEDTVLGRAEQTLLAYHRACHSPRRHTRRR